MPKKPKTNGFMMFTTEWRSKYGKKLSLAEATEEAGKIWGSMTVEERAPYNDRARQERMGQKSGRPAGPPKLTCTGKAIEQVEKERAEAEQREHQMKRNIEMTVRNCVKNCQLETQSYFFIMVNYFVKSLKGGIYVPAEILVAEYSLKDGVCRKYHTFINPGPNIYGLHYEAQHHSETSHKLPLPPNAKGESNLGLIYNNVVDFIRDENTGEYPPIYTHRDSITIVESVLEFLKSDLNANSVELKIYSIQYLFYILKEATSEMGEVEQPKSHYITDAYFERDFFEYQTGIACTYHEDIDKSKYCTQSCVTRWGFMFSDYMCRDIAIDLIPGRHVPESTNLAAIINPAPSTYGDTESHISVNSESTYATKAISEHKVYYDDHKTFMSARSNATGRSIDKYDTNEFPSLGAGPSRKKHARAVSPSPAKATRTDHIRTIDIESADDLNPWSSRSRNVPREPDTSHFDIDYTRDDTTDNETTVTGYGRGRMRMNQSTISNATAGSGRGRLLHRYE
ncbi:PREDICTED: protein maelstrom 1-like [Rhagoletis zephyria]|uniref:protein maelstrom 1-like n=1 Tax=Rhagoletis zephyria TaxID=28612 RepID=UPI0008113B15|nr:PREDICTED: protein maelstrom 1-like [Rhagoletis zephyria]